MKEKLSRMLRSGVAMLLVLCMVAGFIPSVAFAAEVKDGDDGIINYVSFGASNVNGFGVEGYISLPGSIEEIMNNPDLIKDMNVFGYQRMPKDSYPYMVAAALNEAAGGTVAGSYNGDATKDPFSKVKVDQMGISSMRMEELGYLLDTFDGDSYTDWRFADIDGDGDGDNWFDKAYGGSLEALKAEYVRAITEADVITMDMGMNNFGVYISHQVGNPAYGETLEDIDPELAADFAKAKAHVKNLVTQYSSEAALLLDGMDSLIDALAYAVVGYCHNFDKVMEKIYELNPDVNVVVVSIQNLMTGLSLELPGIGELPLGDIFGAIINIANLHTATGSPYCDKYVYADVRKGGRVHDYVDDLLAYNGDPATLSQNMKDCFTLYDYDHLAFPLYTLAYTESCTWLLEMLAKTFGDETVALMAYAYLGVIPGAPDTMAQLQAGALKFRGEFLADAKNDFAGYLAAVNAFGSILDDDETAAATRALDDAHAAYVAYEAKIFDVLYDVMTTLMQAGAEDHTISMASLTASMGNLRDEAIPAFQAEINGALAGLRADPENYDYTLNENFYSKLATDAGWDYDALMDAVCMYVRTSIGNSFYSHPSPKGHRQIADAVLTALNEDVTGDDVVEEEVKIALSELYDLVQKYGPEVAAQVWQQWVDAGYVADVEATINELLATLETRYEYYTTEALPAIDASVLELVAQKDALLVELDALKVELAAKKAELEDVISKQEISDIYAPDINIDVELGNNEQTTVPENECVVESATIKGELEAAIRDIEHAIATIEALIADIEADVADMVALAEQIAAAVAELEKHMESIAVAAKDLNAAVLAVAEVLENSNGVVDSVLKSFDAARETALAASKVLDLAMGVANEMIADIDGMIAKVAADAEALYNKVVADLPAALAQMPEEMVMAIGIALYASQYVDVAAIDLALQAKAAEYGITEETLTEEYIMAEIAKIAAEYGVTEESVMAKYNEVTGNIDTHIQTNWPIVKAEFDTQIENLKKDADGKIEALKLELEGYKAQLAELAEDAAEEVKAGIQAQIDRVNADIATVEADLACAIAHVEEAAKLAYEQIVAEAIKVYENTVAALKAQIEALEEQLKAMISDLEATVEGIKAAVEAAKATIEGILNANIESIEDLMNTLVALGAEEAAKLVQSVVDQINAIFKKATSSDLVLHDDFKYVAIGDGSAAPESYVEKLAAELNVEAASKGYNEISYDNNAKAGNTVAAERANLSDVTGADLITVGFSNVNFLSEALTKATAGAEIDWSNYVGEENVEYVDELLAEVDAKLAEGIEDAATRAYVMNIAEAYAYSAVEYAVELPALINEINAVNSDALVIIVGMYNPLENVTIALDETTTLDIGEYVDYLVKGVAVHGIAYSVLTGNAIYVDAPAVETAVSGKTLGLVDLMGLLTSNFAGMYPTEAGHEYIKNQILNALDLDTDMLGDADGNGKITTNDAKLVLQYVVKLIGADDLNLKVCDVDGNGSITTNDAKLILQYVVELINKFPAEV